MVDVDGMRRRRRLKQLCQLCQELKKGPSCVSAALSHGPSLALLTSSLDTCSDDMVGVAPECNGGGWQGRGHASLPFPGTFLGLTRRKKQ